MEAIFREFFFGRIQDRQTGFFHFPVAAVHEVLIQGNLEQAEAVVRFHNSEYPDFSLKSGRQRCRCFQGLPRRIRSIYRHQDFLEHIHSSPSLLFMDIIRLFAKNPFYFLLFF